MLELHIVDKFQHMEFCDHCCGGASAPRNPGAIIPYGEQYFYSTLTREKIRLKCYYEMKMYYENLEIQMRHRDRAQSQTEYAQLLKDYSKAIAKKPLWLDEEKMDIMSAKVLASYGKYSKEYKEYMEKRHLNENKKK